MIEEALEKMAHEQRKLTALGGAPAPSAACAFNGSASGSDIMKSRWKSSRMGDPHHLDDLLRDTAGVLLLDQLRKDAFKIGQAHQLVQDRRGARRPESCLWQ